MYSTKEGLVVDMVFYYPSRRADLNPKEMRAFDLSRNVRNIFGLHGDCPMKRHGNLECFECLDNVLPSKTFSIVLEKSGVKENGVR